MIKEDLIVDNYYKLLYTNSDFYYFKFSHIEFDRIYTKGNFCIKNNIFMKTYGLSVYFTDGYILEKILISDILMFFPKNHPEIINFRKERIKKLLLKWNLKM